MDKRIWSLLPTVLLSVILVVSLGVGGCQEEKGPQWTKAIEMMELVPSEITGFMYVDAHKTDSDFVDQMKAKMDWPTNDFYGQDWNAIDSVGFFGSDYDNFPRSLICEGAFDAISMASALEGEAGFDPASRCGGILLWTRDQDGIALIDRFIVAGNTERVQDCIDIAQAEGESLSDNADAQDVIGRLPEDDGFSLTLEVAASGENAGCLAQASTFRPAITFTMTIVEKYEDVDSARARVAHLKAERNQEGDPTGFRISRAGVFVTWTTVIDYRDW